MEKESEKKVLKYKVPEETDETIRRRTLRAVEYYTRMKGAIELDKVDESRLRRTFGVTKEQAKKALKELEKEGKIGKA